MKNKIHWQKQKDKKEQNLKKILQALANKEKLGFEEIRRQTGLSRRTLNSHLKTLREKGEIVKLKPTGDKEYDVVFGNNKYMLSAPEAIAFSYFANFEGSIDYAEYDPLKQKANRPEDCLDKYGLLPFDPSEQKKRAEELTRKLVDRLLFTMMKLALYAEEGNAQKKALWVQKILESIPETVQSQIMGYLNGLASLWDNEGRWVEDYYGDDSARQGQAYLGDSDLVRQIKLPSSLKVFYRNPEILAEANRRRGARLRFLVEAIKKLADDENLNYLGRIQERLEKFAKGEVKSPTEADWEKHQEKLLYHNRSKERRLRLTGK